MVKKVIISNKCISFLESRGLSKQYKKAKLYLLNGYYTKIHFSLRQPKSEQIYYFRINKQYRAWGFLDQETLKIFRIDDHQSG